jgi:3-isopropylmalate/(R)-2-methylmalate dehydratase small subunit
MPRVLLKLGDDVSTDVIYPGRYMATVLPGETPAHAFADHPGFQAAINAGAIAPGSVVAAGRNFGCGSSREQAASCLKGHELTIVGRSFARIFLQNAINLGLNIVIAPGFGANEGDEIAFEEGRLRVLTSNRAFEIQPLPKARQAILDAGGLVPYTRARLVAARTGPRDPEAPSLDQVR